MSPTWIQSLPSVKEKGNQEVNKLMRSSHFPIGSDFCVAIEIFPFFCLPILSKNLCAIENQRKKYIFILQSLISRTYTCMYSQQATDTSRFCTLIILCSDKIFSTEKLKACRICGSVRHPLRVHERAMKIFSAFGIAYQGLPKRTLDWHWELGSPAFILPLFLAMIMKIANCFHGTSSCP